MSDLLKGIAVLAGMFVLSVFFNAVTKSPVQEFCEQFDSRYYRQCHSKISQMEMKMFMHYGKRS